MEKLKEEFAKARLEEDTRAAEATQEIEEVKAEHKKTATRGGGDHAASQRNEFDDVKTEVKNMKEDIKVILLRFEKTMKVMEENLHLAKEEICGAKARIEMLEADIKKVVQTDDRGIPAVVTAPPQPAPVAEAPQSPVVTALGLTLVERAPPPAVRRCGGRSWTRRQRG